MRQTDKLLVIVIKDRCSARVAAPPPKQSPNSCLGQSSPHRARKGQYFTQEVWMEQEAVYVGIDVAKPESTEGGREDSGRGVRELRARWPGLHWGRW